MKQIYLGILCTLCLAPTLALAHGYGRHGGGYRDDYGGGGYVDLSYVADEKEKYTQDDPVNGHFADEGSGDGFGIRGLVHAYNGLALEGEYRSASHEFSGFSGDTDDSRIGIGWVAPSNSGVFVEWNKLKFSDVSGGTTSTFTMDGWAVRGRLAGEVAPQVGIFGEAAYVDMKDDFDLDWTGPEFLAGGTFALNDMFSLFADYRIRQLKASDDPSGTRYTERFNSLELGARFTFGG